MNIRVGLALFAGELATEKPNEPTGTHEENTDHE